MCGAARCCATSSCAVLRLCVGNAIDAGALALLRDFGRTPPLVGVFVDWKDPRHAEYLVRLFVPRLRAVRSARLSFFAPIRGVRAGSYSATWSSAALGIAFMRAHIGHPFARSVVPLISTVVALNDRAVEGTRTFDKKCGVLLSSAFAMAHFAAATSQARGGGASSGDGDGSGDSDGDVIMMEVRRPTKRKR
jgi:hypothetical protein